MFTGGTLAKRGDIFQVSSIFRRAAWEREVYLSDQIESFKQHLLGHIPWNLMEKALGESRAVSYDNMNWF